MLELLKSSPIVPVFYHADPDYACRILDACQASGLRVFEFTNRGEAAFEVFKQLHKHARAHCPGMLLGIGTIYTDSEALRFLEAGADFIVQPVTTSAVGSVCREAKKPWIPGALTLNEIWSAWQHGATVVKLFPGNLVGPEYIQALRGPLPNVPLMVTGGVRPEPAAIRQWLDAGVQAVGIGSQLFKGDFSGDFQALARHLSTLLHNLKTASE